MSADLPVLENPPATRPPTELLVRFGYLRTVGKLPYEGDDRPWCGCKVVLRTRRGTELGEVLSVGCGDGGCGKQVSCDKIRAYIEQSGGDEYPFTTEGRVLRRATPEDLNDQKHIDQQKPQYRLACEQYIRELQLPMKLVDVELILGGEMATFYFASEHRVDFRALVKNLAAKFRTRIQMHQIGARDEARLVADYETCGQQCCCRQFLKVLRPVNMSSAKMQKATLDPSKVSGRCGRLKCCLRFEEFTYQELRRRLPRNGTRVRTTDGVGVVEEGMIITQLVKVRLDETRIVVVGVDDLLERDVPEIPGESAPPRPRREPRDTRPQDQADSSPSRGGNGDGIGPRPPRQRPARGPRPPAPQQSPSPESQPQETEAGDGPQPSADSTTSNPGLPPPSQNQRPGVDMMGRRRRRGRGRESRGGSA